MQAPWNRRFAGKALMDVANSNTDVGQLLAETAIGEMGTKEIQGLRGQMAAMQGSSGGSSGGSGFDLGGAAQGLIGGLGGLFSGRRSASNPGFEGKANLYDYKPSGIDFSSGWR